MVFLVLVVDLDRFNPWLGLFLKRVTVLLDDFGLSSLEDLVRLTILTDVSVTSLVSAGVTITMDEGDRS